MLCFLTGSRFLASLVLLPESTFSFLSPFRLFRTVAGRHCVLIYCFVRFLCCVLIAVLKYMYVDILEQSMSQFSRVLQLDKEIPLINPQTSPVV